jgi:hypothetical protein
MLLVVGAAAMEATRIASLICIGKHALITEAW